MEDNKPDTYEGEEAVQYAHQHLKKIAARNWEIEFEDTISGEKWIMDYPHSERHGGGPPRLRKSPS